MAVFQPSFRGSTGYGLKFLNADHNDFGGGDMKDILTGTDHLVKAGIADRDRQFVYGVSYGGYMTSWLVGHALYLERGDDGETEKVHWKR